MFYIKWIRDNPDAFDDALAKRGIKPAAQELIELDGKRRASVSSLQAIQTNRKAISKEIGTAKGAGDDAKAQTLMQKVAKLKTSLQEGEETERELTKELEDALSVIPNLPLDDVPEGGDENENKELRREGVLPEFDFEPKQHFELGEQLGCMDFEIAAKMSGARFVVLYGALARMERALASFMLDIHTREFGYLEVAPPFLVESRALYGTGQLPKFAEDLFKTRDGPWLIPTAEVPLTNLVREQIINESELPKRFAACSPCFRSEAGSAGRDTRGMIRQHQFTKVELVSITAPDQSADELERMLGCAEEILKRLGLAYRVILLCTGDMGFAACKTYDIEVWLPGQDAYREISSCSLCGDFQARRLQARFKAKGAKQTAFVHTLNGSGLAIGRTLVALMENYQQADGSIIIPEALRPYMNGQQVIEA